MLQTPQALNLPLDHMEKRFPNNQRLDTLSLSFSFFFLDSRRVTGLVGGGHLKFHFPFLFCFTEQKNPWQKN